MTKEGHLPTAAFDSGSQKVQHVFDGFKYNCESSSLTIDGPPENSSDLERAGAARSIDDKFSGGPSIVRKLRRCEVKWFSLSRCTFWDPESEMTEPVEHIDATN